MPERVWLHWGMTLATHRFAFDLATHTGRLLALQDDVSVRELRRRMAEGWGERSTLEHAMQRALANFVEWGLLGRTDRRGVYRAAPKRTSTQAPLRVWLMEAWLRAKHVPCASLQQIENAPALFPFEMDLVRSEVRQSSRLELTRQGADTEMVALR